MRSRRVVAELHRDQPLGLGFPYDQQSIAFSAQ